MDELLREQARKDATVTLPPRKVKGWVHELKVSLSDAEALRYETRHPGEDGAVAFNLHRHHGRDVTYYAQEDRAAVAGTFRAPCGGRLLCDVGEPLGCGGRRDVRRRAHPVLSVAIAARHRGSRFGRRFLAQRDIS